MQQCGGIIECHIFCCMETNITEKMQRSSIISMKSHVGFAMYGKIKIDVLNAMKYRQDLL